MLTAPGLPLTGIHWTPLVKWTAGLQIVPTRVLEGSMAVCKYKHTLFQVPFVTLRVHYPGAKSYQTAGMVGELALMALSVNYRDFHLTPSEVLQ